MTVRDNHHSAPARFEHGHALLVGVGADLPITVQDAIAIRDLLVDSARCAYPAEQVQLLTGGNARRADILAAFDILARSTDAQSTVLVYFSGHGGHMPEYHLLPYGYNPADLANTALSGTEFTARLQTLRVGKLIVLLDCCHAGGIAEPKGPVGTVFVKAPAPPELASVLDRGSGRVVIASSRGDEFSYAGQPNSAFTAALLEALTGYGAVEHDGYARVLDVFTYLTRAVPQRTGERQHPLLKASDLDDNFALAYYAGGAKVPLPLPDALSDLPPTPSTLSAEAVSTLRRMLANHRDNLLLIEERMSEFVEFAAIPLQLVREKRLHERKIAELEQRLRGVA